MHYYDFLTIIIGVLAAFSVNLLFMPPKYETKLFQSIHQAQDEIIRWTRLAGRQASEHIATKKSLTKLKERLTQVTNFIFYLKKNEAISKRIPEQKQENLSFIRQMIATSRSSYDVLKRLHQFENELIDLPEHFRMMVQERLDTLLTYHEQLHLKICRQTEI